MFKVRKTDLNALEIRLNATGGKKWEQWFLLRSDVHHDNPHSDRELETYHLKQAVEKKAGIIDCGDLFCAMQGKYDRRSNKSSLRPEHQVDDYLDALVRTATDYYEPYARNFINFGYGNHETAIMKNHETDLTQRLAATLNDRTGSKIATLGYTGWIKFMCNITKTRRQSRNLWYTHGYGGGGPVTQDMIQSSRQQVYIQNADILLSGHVHRSWTQEFVKHRLTDSGKVERREGIYVKLPTYKDTYGKGQKGFEVEKGMGPRPIGAYWLRFYNKDNMIRFSVVKAD